MTEAERKKIEGRSVLLYDGLCGMCNRSVQFCLPRDHRNRLLYIPLQSRLGRELLARHGETPERLNSAGLLLRALLPKEVFYSHSDAVARTLQELQPRWSAAGKLLGWVPRWLRQPAYRLVARIRYRVFGRYDICPLPDEKYRGRFLGLDG